MKNIVKKIVVIGTLILITSCSLNIWWEWVNVENEWDHVKINQDGVDIKSGEGTVKVWADWVNITSGGESVEIWVDWIDVGEEELSVSCEKNYNDLFKKYEKNFSDCYFKKPNTSSCESESTEAWKINIVVIFDDSWSMWAKIWDETMIDIAKDKISDYVNDLDDSVNLSFVLYWHKWSWTAEWKDESCNWVEAIYNFWNENKEGLVSKISWLKPNWRTPIATSLKKAKDLVKAQSGENDKNIILLVSDWKETCWGNPVTEALKISKGMKNTFVDVIWFNVKGDTQKQLMDIAKRWGWNYYDVKNRLDFEDTFNKTQNFLNAMSCWASKAAIELWYWAEAINKYHMCMYSLNEEQVFMMADADEDCKGYFQDKLENRYDKYEEEFDVILEEWEAILDNFWKLIKEVEEKFED